MKGAKPKFRAKCSQCRIVFDAPRMHAVCAECSQRLRAGCPGCGKPLALPSDDSAEAQGAASNVLVHGRSWHVGCFAVIHAEAVRPTLSPLEHAALESSSSADSMAVGRRGPGPEAHRARYNTEAYGFMGTAAGFLDRDPVQAAHVMALQEAKSFLPAQHRPILVDDGSDITYPVPVPTHLLCLDNQPQQRDRPSSIAYIYHPDQPPMRPFTSYSLEGLLHRAMAMGLVKERSHRFRTHRNTIVGKEFVSFLVSTRQCSTREEAQRIGSAMLECGMLVATVGESISLGSAVGGFGIGDATAGADGNSQSKAPLLFDDKETLYTVNLRRKKSARDGVIAGASYTVAGIPTQYGSPLAQSHAVAHAHAETAPAGQRSRRPTAASFLSPLPQVSFAADSSAASFGAGSALGLSNAFTSHQQSQMQGGRGSFDGSSDQQNSEDRTSSAAPASWEARLAAATFTDHTLTQSVGPLHAGDLAGMATDIAGERRGSQRRAAAIDERDVMRDDMQDGDERHALDELQAPVMLTPAPMKRRGGRREPTEATPVPVDEAPPRRGSFAGGASTSMLIPDSAVKSSIKLAAARFVGAVGIGKLNLRGALPFRIANISTSEALNDGSQPTLQKGDSGDRDDVNDDDNELEEGDEDGEGSLVDDRNEQDGSTPWRQTEHHRHKSGQSRALSKTAQKPSLKSRIINTLTGRKPKLSGNDREGYREHSLDRDRTRRDRVASMASEADFDGRSRGHSFSSHADRGNDDDMDADEDDDGLGLGSDIEGGNETAGYDGDAADGHLTEDVTAAGVLIASAGLPAALAGGVNNTTSILSLLAQPNVWREQRRKLAGIRHDLLYRVWKKGWLVKQGHVRKNWKRRWFVLQGFTLSYSKKESHVGIGAGSRAEAAGDEDMDADNFGGDATAAGGGHSSSAFDAIASSGAAPAGTLDIRDFSLEKASVPRSSLCMRLSSKRVIDLEYFIYAENEADFVSWVKVLSSAMKEWDEMFRCIAALQLAKSAASMAYQARSAQQR